MAKDNNVRDFFKDLANALRFKVGTDETFSSSAIADVIAERIKEDTSGTFVENLTCFNEDGTLGITNMYVDSVDTVGDSAYRYLSNLETVMLQEGLTTISQFAFDGCTSLVTCLLPKSVTTIGSCAFRGCNKLEDFGSFDNVSSVGGLAFSGTGWLNNHQNGLVYCGNNVLYTYKGDIEEEDGVVKTKDGIRSISGEAFRDKTSLKKFEVTSNRITVNGYAFVGCSNLEEVRFYTENQDNPGGVLLQTNSFTNCPNLETLYFEHVNNIVAGSFSGSTNLKNVYILNNDIPTTLSSTAFNGQDKTVLKIYVRPELVEAWKEKFSGYIIEAYTEKLN